MSGKIGADGIEKSLVVPNSRDVGARRKDFFVGSVVCLGDGFVQGYL